MSLNVNNLGSIFEGRDIEGQGLDIIESMTASLAAANIKFANYDFKSEDLSYFTQFVNRVEGNSGTVLPVEEFRMFFQSAGDVLSPKTYNEKYSKWVLYSESYEALNASFTPRWWKKSILSGANPGSKIIQRTKDAIKTYEKIFLPNLIFQSMLHVPADGADYYDDFGALRNTEVSEGILLNVDDGATAGDVESTTRNHYRAIKNDTGVEIDDYRFISRMMNNYSDVNVSVGRAFCSLGTSQELIDLFDDTMTTDNLNKEGMVGKINNIPHEVVKMLPENIVMFMFAEPGDTVFAELTSPDARFKGLRIEGRTIGMAFDKLQDLQNSKFVIEDIGMHLVGRHRVVFLDIDPNRNDEDNRLMTEAGLQELRDKAVRLEKEWKRDNIIVK